MKIVQVEMPTKKYRDETYEKKDVSNQVIKTKTPTLAN
jgi:hypothetical protein